MDGSGAFSAGVVLSFSPWIDRRRGGPHRTCRLLLLGVAIVTVAGFLSIRLLR
jgi:hypothetical protein